MVRVVTDSAANLPIDLVDELGIVVVSLHVSIGDRAFRDGVDIGMQEFYEQLQASGDVATTSAPSVGDFLEAFGDIPAGEAVVCVTVAADVSATNQAARAAAAELDRPIEVIDSLNASMAELAAADRVEQGGLAGAVRSDQRDDAGPGDDEIHTIEGGDAPEPLAQALDLKQVRHGAGTGRTSRALGEWPIPRGSCLLRTTVHRPP